MPADEMSLSETMNSIEILNLKTQTISKTFEKKNQENAELKISLNRLILLKTKLLREIKNINKTKTEYEDELNYMLCSNRKMVSKINFQFAEIQRLMTEKDEKIELIDHHIKTTKLLPKRLEREKKEEYYKSLCKTLMIEDILYYNSINAEKAKMLTLKYKILNEKFSSSKKDLKKILEKVELCKYRLSSYFDNTCESVDKTETLKLIVSSFNQLITVGYMCYWESKAEIFYKIAKLWTVHNPCGMPIKFNAPFYQTIMSFPTADGVPSFEACYRIKSVTRVNENTIDNNN